MADRNKAVRENVRGDFFVDSSCIDCDACRQLAPDTFQDAGAHSFVYAQPETKQEKHRALLALLSCPTGSIGSSEKADLSAAKEDLPLKLEDGVYYCGFNSPKSYGGNSFFVQHKNGNWLVDSPKFLPHLVEQFKKLGGIKYIFLTHQDDVADADKYAQKFGAKRIIHRFDARAMSDCELIIEGEDPQSMDEDFLIIPQPGHTRGHMVLLVSNRYLFTGDHLAYNAHKDCLMAYEDYCWYSWEEQTRSMKRLLKLMDEHPFEWILAGHGNRVHWTKERMKLELSELVESMGES